MANMMPARSFNLALCAALGLNPTKVRAITIRSKADEAVVVEVDQLMPVGEADAVLAVLRRYTLTPIDKE